LGKAVTRAIAAECQRRFGLAPDLPVPDGREIHLEFPAAELLPPYLLTILPPPGRHGVVTEALAWTPIGLADQGEEAVLAWLRENDLIPDSSWISIAREAVRRFVRDVSFAEALSPTSERTRVGIRVRKGERKYVTLSS
jgi:hypothetical protein